jgi:hypothetical protein
MKEVISMRFMLIAFLAVVLVMPAFAQTTNTGYHEVYEWGYDGAQEWLVNPEQHAEFYGRNSEHNQYRWESNPAAQICFAPYYPPEPEPPHVKVVTDQAVLFPWIDFNVYEKDLHWDIFKPGVYMGKSFQVFMRANTPVQVLFGCGTISAPVGFSFNPDANPPVLEKEILWGDWTQEQCLTDKIRIASILGKDPPNPGTDPDVLDEYLYWERHCDGRPDPHRIDAEEMARIPDFGDDAWLPAPMMNGMLWIEPDAVELHTGCFFQFYETLVVESCDSEGDYYKEIVMTVAPDP